MAKWWVVLGALAAMLVLIGSASAMPRGRAVVYIGGIPSGSLGHTGFAVPVRSGAPGTVNNPENLYTFACEYRMIWENSSGLNARLCYMHELATSLTPSCSINSTQKLASLVLAGRSQISRSCEGMDINDVAQIVDMIIAGESEVNPGLGLRGVVLMSGGFFDSFSA